MMKRLLVGLLFAAATMMAVERADAVPLTNTAVTAGVICTAFDCGGGSSLVDTYSFSPASNNPDGYVYSLALPGTGAATGSYLYLYLLVNDLDASTAALFGYAVPFANLVPFDWDGDTVASETSMYCSNCGGIIPFAADYDAINNALGWSAFVPGYPTGGTTTFFGAVSTLPPSVVLGNVLSTGVVQEQPDTLAPVPEPGSLILLGSGLLALGARRRRSS